MPFCALCLWSIPSVFPRRGRLICHLIVPLRLTAVILTRNEAENIADCIAALKGWTDEVVVWDSCSRDDTRRVAQDAGAHVVARPFDDYGRQRQAALDSIDSEWILFVDADERATPRAGAGGLGGLPGHAPRRFLDPAT